MKKKNENTDLIATTLGLIVIFIVLLFVNKLVEPIKNREAHEFTEGELGRFFQGLKNMGREAFGKPITPVEPAYSFILNLFIPFLLVCLACGIAWFLVYHLAKTFGDYEDPLLNLLLKGIFILLFLAVISFLVPVALHLLSLNFTVLLVLLLMIVVVLGVVIYKRND